MKLYDRGSREVCPNPALYYKVSRHCKVTHYHVEIESEGGVPAHIYTAKCDLIESEQE